MLSQPPRRPGGYRNYPPAALDLLRFIKRAQELGFTLDEVEELLHLDTGGPEACDAARVLAEQRRADVQAWIRDLQRMHDTLADLVATLRSAPRRPQLRAAGGDRPPPGGDPMKLEVLHIAD